MEKVYIFGTEAIAEAFKMTAYHFGHEAKRIGSALLMTEEAYETVIEKTVDELKEIQPEVIVPMHCTGWKAVKKLADAFPDTFIINSVGSKFSLT